MPYKEYDCNKHFITIESFRDSKLKTPMKPDLTTDLKLAQILEALIKLEHSFHHPEPGISRLEIENMLDTSFWEVGASGQCYDRAHGITTLLERSKIPLNNKGETTNFHCLEIAPNNYLLTYTLTEEKRITHRSTIWRQSETSWKVVYHQGTPTKEESKT